MTGAYWVGPLLGCMAVALLLLVTAFLAAALTVAIISGRSIAASMRTVVAAVIRGLIGPVE